MIRYVPTGRFSKRYAPVLPVAVVVVIPVSIFVASTLAFATMAEEESTTVPTRLPLMAWAYAELEAAASNPNRAKLKAVAFNIDTYRFI